jgi:hypothetical protein
LGLSYCGSRNFTSPENLAYPVIFERFKTSMNENDLNDIFSNVLLITKLADARVEKKFLKY